MFEDDLEVTFDKLKNPRMIAGRVLLYSLLDELKGEPVPPGTVREYVDTRLKDREVSKQSITNAARRLEDVGIIERTEGYSINYGHLISILLHTVMDLTNIVRDLEDEISELKTVMKSDS